MPFQRRRKCIFHWRGRAWLTIWDRVKIPRYSHRHAPEESDLWTAWQLFPLDDDQTCHSKNGGSYTFRWPVMGRYWVGVNYYITECIGNSMSLERRSGREKQHPAEGALETPDWVWRSDPLVTRWGRGSQHPAEWAPGPPVEQHQKNGKETLIAIRVGINMLQFCSVSNSLSHTNLSNKVRGIFF